MRSYKSINEYLDSLPKDAQIVLNQLRQTIKKAAPDATETISYGIPTFKSGGKNLVHFAAFKNHYSFFPTSSGIEAFKKELKEYKTSKGTVQFPLNRPLPLDLITKIVEYRIEENEKRKE